RSAAVPHHSPAAAARVDLRWLSTRRYDGRLGYRHVGFTQRLHPMKGATMLATLQRLGVVSSFSRPSVSDDNAYAESLFRTMKYRAKYPSAGFATVEDASRWVRDFVAWYNEEHQHSGIGYVPPAARHAGEDLAILAARRTTYAIARSKHPERWARHTRAWSRPETVTLNQKVDHAADNTASLAA
ncbi:MAG: integrase core domain-containing protein, partial [Myxococcota bacterium]|nr:integrase core domain-containing protein [Myxococcota bacterium]